MFFRKTYYTSTEIKARKRRAIIALICLALLLLAAASAWVLMQVYGFAGKLSYRNNTAVFKTVGSTFTFNIPEYRGNDYEEIQNNIPFFTDDELTTKSFLRFSPLDARERCGTAYACLGMNTLTTEARGEIGMVKPSGWQTVRYDDLIEDKYLYNRCHLIAFMLSGENANVKNLITGTRYMNVTGMLPFESRVADYIRKTKNHVMYRVTPCFEGSDLVATGVLMEARSVEDNGAGVMFNVFVYNIQPGVVIDYSTGKSKRA